MSVMSSPAFSSIVHALSCCEVLGLARAGEWKLASSASRTFGSRAGGEELELSAPAVEASAAVPPGASELLLVGRVFILA